MILILGATLSLCLLPSAAFADDFSSTPQRWGGESFIGTDPETGDSVMSITPPAPQQQQQPAIPYIVPQVNAGDWQNQPPKPPIILPPGGVYPPGSYPPGSYPPGGLYPPGGSYPPTGTYPPGGQYPPSGGLYPPGSYPPGSYPPGGQYPPTGSYPPGSYPPGIRPPSNLQPSIPLPNGRPTVPYSTGRN